ncbi:hypothetical protein [Sphingomonas sp.]|uniref:hypothetical protein n=1 Tax=Sphingomonas sp. TaxID=28214 RepID=UPI0033424B08
MSALLPQHYALTEAAVAAAGAYATTRSARARAWFAVGLAPFALAALVGTIRIAAGLTGPIEQIHGCLSRSGALFGLGCLAGVLVSRRGWLPPALGFAAVALTVVVPSATASAFVVLVVTGSVFAYRANPARAPLAAACFALLLIGRLATDPLRAALPALAWHAFHLAVAVWLLLLVAIVLPDRKRIRAR